MNLTYRVCTLCQTLLTAKSVHSSKMLIRCMWNELSSLARQIPELGQNSGICTELFLHFGERENTIFPESTSLFMKILFCGINTMGFNTMEPNFHKKWEILSGKCYFLFPQNVKRIPCKFHNFGLILEFGGRAFIFPESVPHRLLSQTESYRMPHAL